MMLGSDLGYIDIFDHAPGIPGDQLDLVFQDIHWVAGRPYISLKFLRMMKRAAGRTRDLLDLENLPEAK